MASSTSKPALACAVGLVFAKVAPVPAAPAPGPLLPDNAVGVWRGKPTTTILGPLGDLEAVFVVQRMSNGQGYLMSDVFGSTKVIPGTWQRFFFEELNGAPVVRYCGMLGAWYDDLDTPAQIPVNELPWYPMAQQASTATAVTYGWEGMFPIPGFPNNFTVTLDITLQSPTTLQLHVRFDIATHLLVTLYKVPGPDPPEFVPPNGSLATCNFTVDSLPTQLVHPWVSPNASQHQRARPGGSWRGCPMAPHRRVATPSEPAPPTPAPGDSVCYMVQEYADLNLSWIIPNKGEDVITFTVKATVTTASDPSAGSYLALGFPSAMPTMANMTIAAVVALPGCVPTVQAFFSPNNFGQPVPAGDIFPITNTAATVEGTTITFTFTRKLACPYAPIKVLPPNSNPGIIPHVYWAMGAASNGALEYHMGNRGMFQANFFHPAEVWAPSREC